MSTQYTTYVLMLLSTEIITSGAKTNKKVWEIRAFKVKLYQNHAYI